jgi:hypothetical protein
MAKMLKTLSRNAALSLNILSSNGVKDLERNVRKKHSTCCTVYNIFDANKETFVSVNKG